MNIPIIEIALSLIFVYLLLSILTSGLTEIWSMWLKCRQKNLKKAIIKALGNKAAKLFYNHPIISGQTDIVVFNEEKNKDKWSKTPSYISLSNFSIVIIDLLQNNFHEFLEISKHEETENTSSNKENIYTQISENLSIKDDANAQLVLFRTLLNNTTNIEEFKANIEQWYDNYMLRIKGWYKRKIKIPAFIISIIIVSFLNIDTIQISQQLYKNKEIAQKIAEQSAKFHKNPISINLSDTTFNTQKINELIKTSLSSLNTIKSAGLPMGWDYVFNNKGDTTTQKIVFTLKNKSYSLKDTTIKTCINPLNLTVETDKHNNIILCSTNISKKEINWLSKILGLLITLFAISLGSPFWFSLLNKIVNIRSNGGDTKVKKKNN